MPDDPSQDGGLDELMEQARQRHDSFDWGEEAEELDEEGAASAEQVSLLRFQIRDQAYAVRAEDVREVIGQLPSTLLPGAPPYIRGIVIHRRQVVGLLDLDRWFKLDDQGAPIEAGRVVIVEHDALLVGLLAGAQTTIIQWPRAALAGNLDALPTRLRKYARAVRDDDAGPVILLDVPRLLEDAALRG